MDVTDRHPSLEEDLSGLCGTPDFLDHVCPDYVTNDVELVDGNLIEVTCDDANIQRFIRIASAQELEELDTFYDTSEDGGNFTPDSGIDVMSQMDLASRAKAEEEWKSELAKTEEEINTLRQVLSAKIRHMQELKKKLGITPWKEFRDDMEHGLKSIQESTAFQKTSQTIKSASEKTSEAMSSLSATVSQKLQEVKNMPAFKNIEEKVGSAYSNVKTKVASGIQPEGSQTLEDALSEDTKTDK